MQVSFSEIGNSLQHDCNYIMVLYASYSYSLMSKSSQCNRNRPENAEFQTCRQGYHCQLSNKNLQNLQNIPIICLICFLVKCKIRHQSFVTVTTQEKQLHKLSAILTLHMTGYERYASSMFPPDVYLITVEVMTTDQL